MPTPSSRVFLMANIVLVVALYVFTEYFCTESCFVFYEKPYLDPLLLGFVGLLATSVILYFSPERVFTHWLKKIASWYLPLTFILIALIGEGEGLFPMTSDGRSDTAILMMALLFVITLVYAIVMNRKLKQGGSAGK